MAALNVEQYKKQISNAFDRWSRKIADSAEMIGKINKEITRLEEQIECATPEGEKKYKAQVEELKKARQKAAKQVEAANLSLRADLMMLEPPEKTKSNEKDFQKLPGFIGKLVEDEGVELGKSGVILKPDIDFDFKAGKLEKFGIELKFKW
jgi:chromosome segregation ATPase